MRIILKQISENKKRILMGIMVFGMLNFLITCSAAVKSNQLPDAPKFAAQNRSPDGSVLYITSFVLVFENDQPFEKEGETMSIQEYEEKSKQVLASYIRSRGFYKSVVIGNPTNIKDKYVAAEVHMEISIGQYYSRYLAIHFPMFLLTPFIWPFHPIKYDYRIKAQAQLKDERGQVLEQMEAAKVDSYFPWIYTLFRVPEPFNDMIKDFNNSIFVELTDKLTVPIEHKNAPAESKPKFTILGEVFAPKGGLVDLKYSGTDVRMGSILYIFQDGQPVCKMVVTQAFHTKVTAKIISSSVTLVKGMQFGKLN